MEPTVAVCHGRYIPMVLPRKTLFVCLHFSSSFSTMAYNREWDQGKSAWGQQQSWNAHPRDDDYYTEGKRRKTNTGVRQMLLILAPLLIPLSRATRPPRHTPRVPMIPPRMGDSPTYHKTSSGVRVALFSRNASNRQSRAPMSFSWV